MSDEILTAVSKPEAVAMAEIHAMRQLADAVTAQTKFFGDAMGAHTRAVERLADKVEDVDRRLIRVEEAKHGREIEELKGLLTSATARIDHLESTRDQQKGAKALVDWLRQTTPWLFGLLIGGGVVFGLKEGIG